MKQIYRIFIAISVGAAFLATTNPEYKSAKPQTIWKLLHELGENYPDHYVEPDDQWIAQGEDLIKHGRTVLEDGSKSAYISKYYTCTSCHNLVREDPDLTVVDQEARLNYAIEKNIPYLQGSTFWGIVNRETWYNDDYVLKYGDLVRKAENSLPESIQLCAKVCSQGRPLEEWEMKSILAYLWSIQMTLSDIDLSIEDLQSIPDDEKVNFIKSKYLLKSPATFADPPEDKDKGYDYTGSPELGEAIFELGCQHCHRPMGESEVVFENNALTLNWLERHITDKGDLSIYEIIRKGTYSEYGHKEYMPHYTLEKMSHQQVEDLRAFIEQGPI
ncbi:c-type cytochrome [Marinoscillum sp. MHG1-6]|uniref:c-type cytochrome n=1 Tax=Marinoscillum sp. MHG1-6 TaxID=2959627 RepID=UPI00215726E5|nr:c-type cytochrome [Marinoscillum sp. MHG1-6]